MIARTLFLFLLLGIAFIEGQNPLPIPKFNCPKLSPPPPATNVRKLRPGNIKVAMAMGDSITAGFAMKGIFPTNFLEYRDYVYSIGGAEGAQTLPNWLKTYNPDIKGVAESWTWPLTKGAWLNAGVSMARVEELLPQVDYLVNELNTTYKGEVNFNEDWKLLTLFIGANNICPACKNSSKSTPEHFEKHLRATLEMIHAKIPRVFVNLITIFNISGVWDAGQKSEYCKMLWTGVTECSCLTTGKASDREAMDVTSVKFNQVSQKLAKEFSDISETFTVVVQPGLTGIPIGKFGVDFLSHLDCFHPALSANEAFTYLVWNNMMTPVGKKETSPDPDNIKIICPTEDTFLQ